MVYDDGVDWSRYANPSRLPNRHTHADVAELQRVVRMLGGVQIELSPGEAITTSQYRRLEDARAELERLTKRLRVTAGP